MAAAPDSPKKVPSVQAENCKPRAHSLLYINSLSFSCRIPLLHIFNVSDLAASAQETSDRDPPQALELAAAENPHDPHPTPDTAATAYTAESVSYEDWQLEDSEWVAIAAHPLSVCCMHACMHNII
jgi:hypothetical protein